MLWIFSHSCYIQPKLHLKCPNTYPYEPTEGEGTFTLILSQGERGLYLPFSTHQVERDKMNGNCAHL